MGLTDYKAGKKPGNFDSFPLGSHGKTALYLLAVVFLPNLIFHLTAVVLGLSRPLLNIDYVLAAALVAFGYARAGLIFAIIFSIFDAFQIVNQIYPFVRISDLLVLLKLLPNSSSWHVMILAVTVMAVMLSAALVFYFSQRVRRLDILFVLNIVLLWFVVVRVVSPQEIDTAWRVERKGIVDSAALFFVEHRIVGNASKFFVRGELLGSKIGSASSNLEREVEPRNVLLVVAESWGDMKNKTLADKIVEPIMRLAESRGAGVVRGSTDFVGPTVAAEMRELCGTSLQHLNMLEIADDMSGCLPHKYNKEGYHTVALHAALGSIYWRNFWYPRVGFIETRFKEDGRWKSECKSFPGACDEEIARTDIRDLLEFEKPVFVYWLTLNSHQPYSEDDIRSGQFDCSEFDFPADGEMCRMVKLHAQFFIDLSNVLSGSYSRPVEIIVVGDHTPPLIDLHEARKQLEFGRVPWLHFVLN